jgi:hypothetical protein
MTFRPLHFPNDAELTPLGPPSKTDKAEGTGEQVGLGEMEVRRRHPPVRIGPIRAHLEERHDHRNTGADTEPGATTPSSSVPRSSAARTVSLRCRSLASSLPVQQIQNNHCS